MPISPNTKPTWPKYGKYDKQKSYGWCLYLLSIDEENKTAFRSVRQFNVYSHGVCNPQINIQSYVLSILSSNADHEMFIEHLAVSKT